MHNIIEYIPKVRDTPSVVKVVSAWCDIPTILKDIIVTFDINPQTALEFGVEYGYSTSALANYFTKVIGVDTFMGDIHSDTKTNHYKVTKRTLKNRYKNIQLIQSSYQDYIKTNNSIYDLNFVTFKLSIVSTVLVSFSFNNPSLNSTRICAGKQNR